MSNEFLDGLTIEVNRAREALDFHKKMLASYNGINRDNVVSIDKGQSLVYYRMLGEYRALLRVYERNGGFLSSREKRLDDEITEIERKIKTWFCD